MVTDSEYRISSALLTLSQPVLSAWHIGQNLPKDRPISSKLPLQA